MQTKLQGRLKDMKLAIQQFGVSRLIVFCFFILLLCLTSAQDFPSTITNILTRVGMHGVLVLCMVPSIRAGLGPNFAVPFGVLAGIFLLREPRYPVKLCGIGMVILGLVLVSLL